MASTGTLDADTDRSLQARILKLGKFIWFLFQNSNGVSHVVNDSRCR